MELNKTNEIASELDEKNRKAILKLIDLKTESDMEKVLEKIDHLEKSNQNLKWFIATAITLAGLIAGLVAAFISK